MDQDVQEDDRYQKQRKWMKSILYFSSDENDSDNEIKDEPISYPLDTGQVIALRFPYPMISDESEEEDNVVIFPKIINKKRKLSCSSESDGPVVGLNYKHKRRKKNCISDSEDTNSDNSCDNYSKSHSTKTSNCKTKSAKKSKSFEISDKENRLSLKRTRTSRAPNKKDHLINKRRSSKNEKVAELLEPSYDLKNSKAHTSKKEIKGDSRFLDSSSENDETSSHKPRKTKLKLRRLTVLSTSSSSSDGENQDSNDKTNPSPNGASASLNLTSPNPKSPEVEQENDSDPDYTPTIEEDICRERKHKLSFVHAKPLLSNNNSNAWKNIANLSLKSRQMLYPSKVQSLKRKLLSCNMSSVEIHKKIYSKPINNSKIKETSAKTKYLQQKSNISSTLDSTECSIDKPSASSNLDKHNFNEVKTNDLPSNKQFEEGRLEVKNPLQQETDINAHNSKKINEISMKSKSLNMNDLNVPSKLEQGECTIDKISSVSTITEKDNNEAVNKYLPLNKYHEEGLIDKSESEKNNKSKTSRLSASQPNSNKTSTTPVDNKEELPTVNKKVRQSHYKQSENTSQHLKQTSAKPEHKKVRTKSADTDSNTSNEKECISNASERQVDILGDIISQMNKNPFKIQKLPLKQTAQPTGDTLGRAPLGDSFEVAGRLCQSSIVKSKVPDKETVQSKQMHSSELSPNNTIQSQIHKKDHAIVPTATGNSQVKSNPTEINKRLSTDNNNPNASNSCSLPIETPRVESGIIIPFYSAQSEEYVSNPIGGNVKNNTVSIDSIKKNRKDNRFNLPNVEENKSSKQCLTQSSVICNQEKNCSSSNSCNNNHTINPTTSKNLSSIYSQSKKEVSNKNVKEPTVQSNVKSSNRKNIMERSKYSQVKTNEHSTKNLDTHGNLKYRNTNLIQNQNKNMVHKVKDKYSNDRMTKNMEKDKHNQGTNRYSVKNTTYNKAGGDSNDKRRFRDSNSIVDSKEKGDKVFEKGAITAKGSTIHQQLNREKSLKTIKGSQENKEAHYSKPNDSSLKRIDKHITGEPYNISREKEVGENKKDFTGQHLISDNKEMPKRKGIRIRFGGSEYRLPGSQSNSDNKNDSKNHTSNEATPKNTFSIIDQNVECNDAPENKRLIEEDSSTVKNGMLKSAKGISNMITDVDDDDSTSINLNKRMTHSISSSDDSSSCDSSSSETSSGSTSTTSSKFEDANTDNDSSCNQKTDSVDKLYVSEKSDTPKTSTDNISNDNAVILSLLSDSEKLDTPKTSTDNINNDNVVILSLSSDSEKLDTLEESNTDIEIQSTCMKDSETIKSEPVTPIINKVGKIRVRSLKELGADIESNFPENALSHNSSASVCSFNSSTLTKTTAQSEQVVLTNTQQNLCESEIPNEPSVPLQTMHSNLDSLFKMNISSTNKQKLVSVKNPVSSPIEKSKSSDMPTNNLSNGTPEISKNIPIAVNQQKSGPSTECRNVEQTIKLPIPVEVTPQPQDNALRVIQVSLANKETENLFFQLCDNLFTDLLYCKIPKLVDDLHLLILHERMREERLQKISQLSCLETIASEKRRIERDFSDQIKVRSYSFVPLFMTIVSKINKSDFRALVIAVYCRIVQHLEKVDPVNTNYKFKVRFIIKSMLEKSSCKEGHENLNALFGQNDSDFLPTFVFVEDLLKKYDSYIENRQKVSTVKTSTNTGDKRCNTTEKVSAAENSQKVSTVKTSTNTGDKRCNTTEKVSAAASKNETSTSTANNTANASSSSSFSLNKKSNCIDASTLQTNRRAPVCISTSEGKSSTNQVTKEGTQTPQKPTPLIGNLDQMWLFKVTPTKKTT